MRIFSKYSLLFLLGISTWIPILVINFFYWINYLKVGYAIYPEYLPAYLRYAFYAAFFVSNYVLIDQIIKRIEKWDVIDLLWKLLVIGISGISITFLFQIIEQYMQTDALFPQVKALSASVKLYATLVFCLSTVFIYRKLILYQKNKRKVISWYGLQFVFLLGLARLFIGGEPDLLQNFINFNTIDPSVETSEFATLYTTIILPMFLGISLFLSANVNWSAYLNFNQKLKSLFLIFIIILLFVAFLLKFPYDALQPTTTIFELMRGRYLLIGLFFLFPRHLYTLLGPGPHLQPAYLLGL